jgi:hypothetical protein
VTITSPPPSSDTTGSATTVKGLTTPGATVVVAAGQPGSANDSTSVSQTVAGAGGGFQVAVATPKGTTVVTVTSTTGARATGWAQETVKNSG